MDHAHRIPEDLQLGVAWAREKMLVRKLPDARRDLEAEPDDAGKEEPCGRDESDDAHEDEKAPVGIPRRTHGQRGQDARESKKCSAPGALLIALRELIA